MNQVSQTGSVSATRVARAQERRKLGPMAYVELGQDNGGILLNLGEGGFAVQSALAFQAIEFPELRFQIPQRRGWQTARGRIAWMSENKTVAGIQFLELPEATRREIRNWIAAKENGEPAIGKEDVEPQRNISATTYRGDPRIQAARKANPEKPPRSPGSNQGSRRVANPAPASATQIGSQATGAIGTTAEAPEQDFRFNDYSMFAAVPSREEVWGDGGRQKRSSQRLALASILIAALFFILGATIGRGTVDHWIAYVGTWMQGPTAPSVKPPAPVDQSSSAVPDRSEISQRDGSGAGGNQTGDAGQTQNETPATNPAAAAHATSATGESHAEPRERATAEVSSEAKTSVRGDEMGAVATTPMATPAPKQPTKAGASRSSYSASEGESPHVGEHSILVNAPEPGNPPFIVNLPSDAISASSTVAISARRSMQVLPRAGQPGSHSERVVIGRLISHSEPFYPVEARYRRLEGGVEVHATIGRTGQVISVRSVSGPTLLASAAMTAVREWRYEPTFIDGDPVETQAEITMVFRLP